MRALSAFVSALLLAGCFTPDLGDGAVACGVADQCPPRYVCRADKHCWKSAGDALDLGGGSTDFAGCMLATCGAQSCGVISDNCGSTIDCGNSCSMGKSCGGGGTPHQCGCPSQMSCGGRNCGTILDGCGGVESCGASCPTGETCGGGSGANKKPNVCGGGQACQPKVCQAGKDCGLLSDGCAAVLDCGACAGGKSCGTDHMCH